MLPVRPIPVFPLRIPPFSSSMLLAFAVGALVALPLLGVLWNAVAGGRETVEIWHHLLSTVLWTTVWTTALLGGGVMLGVSMVGCGAAWLVSHYRFPGRRVLSWALFLPLAVPAYVIAYAYTDFLQFSGPVQTELRALTGWRPRSYWFPDVRSLPGAVVMFVFVLYPYVYALARTAFAERSPHLLDAARTLGCSPNALFWRVALPLARPAMLAGAMLALMETLADFGAVAYFGIPTFTRSIYNTWFGMGDRTAAAQLAVCLLALVAAALWVERRARGRARFSGARAERHEAALVDLSGWRAWMATGLCVLPVLLGFVIPCLILLNLWLREPAAVFGSRYGEWIVNSVMVSGIAAGVACIVAVLLAYAERLHTHRAVRVSNALVNLGYAVPGSVIAVGILIPLARMDNAIDAWMQGNFNLSTGLLMTGTIFALVYAYLVRYFAVAYQTVEAGLLRITPAMDASARSLGASPWEVLRRIHVPLMRRSVWTAVLLVFVDAMKELPATLILRPFNFDTLAVVTHNFAQDERLAEAALPALTMVAVGVLPVLLLSRAAQAQRDRHS